MNKNYRTIVITVLLFLLIFYFIKNRSYYEPKGYTRGFHVVPKGGSAIPPSVCIGPNVIKKEYPKDYYPNGGGFCAINTRENAEKMCSNSAQCGGFTVYQGTAWIKGAKAQLFDKAGAKSGTKPNKDWNTWFKN